jgi:hypothetical protein
VKAHPVLTIKSANAIVFFIIVRDAKKIRRLLAIKRHVGVEMIRVIGATNAINDNRRERQE